MDTLYLVFKDRFQIVFGFALLTEKFSLKQTETLTYQLYSVKAASSVRKKLFLATKRVAFLAKFPKKKSATRRRLIVLILNARHRKEGGL